jgi:hypothetical protein
MPTLIKYLVLFATCLVTNSSPGQSIQYGFILPSDVENIGGLFSDTSFIGPKGGFTVFSKPNGDTTGILSPEFNILRTDEGSVNEYYISTKNSTIKCTPDVQFVTYGRRLLYYSARKEGFVKISDDSPELWISEKEIHRKNYRLVEWQEFLTANSGLLVGYYAKGSGLNLRESPSVKGKLIKTLKGDLFEITPTGECVGLWAKVKVTKYLVHPCNFSGQDEVRNIEYVLEGWIKIVDEQGLPNITWYFSC